MNAIYASTRPLVLSVAEACHDLVEWGQDERIYFYLNLIEAHSSFNLHTHAPQEPPHV
ncbi:MAG: hypothetical protein QX199_02835 [Methylococcaceae bacterium]